MSACTSPAPTVRSTPRRMAPSSADTWRSRISSSGGAVSITKSLPFWSGFSDKPPPARHMAPYRRSSPTSVDPFLQVRGLAAHGGRAAVPGQHQGVGVEGGENAAVDRLNDGGEVPTLHGGVARTAWEERVPGEQEVRSLDGEADR